MQANLKVSRAIVRLCNTRPFFGSMALMLPVKESTDPSVDTMCTNGVEILWNRDFVDTMTEEETEGVIAHEIMHVVWLHHARLGERNPQKWNIATDFSINQTLVDDKMTLPKDVLLDPQYRGMSAEQIYPLIEDQYEECPWGGVIPLKNSDGSEMTEAEKQGVRDKIQQMTVSAAEAAKQSGKGLPGGIDGLIENIRKPQVNWKALLRATLMMKNPAEQSWSRPNRRYLADNIYLPSNISNQLGPIALVLDTSGSVSQEEREVFLAELDAINKELKPESMHVICNDSDIAECFTFTPEDDITGLNMKGYGGTDMQPGLNYIEECLPEVETILVFSDCEFFGDWPREPVQPLVWLSTGETDNPYGNLIKVDF